MLKRYARANNKYMSYDPSTYLMYFDVNNLTVGQCVNRYADFRWVDNVENFDDTTVVTDSPMDYVLKVDLEYSQHLHDAHTDLSFCSTLEKPSDK
ncbi:PREDICTED: uncharacterized protein LOC105622974 [Atta cephalotes]|uniref:Uncharacterized protein n=1 Tax=Atta cephalotes TaxID=12957 RepID=A0A158NQG0_ATTCE|nr:PREDICTED: uncharacterized protein LOC105622974 [Atta cephalotes]